ncbi:MAG: hypothetical protein AB7F41_04880 [Methylocystis sp.]|uniref:hypothetical protein n=1 Tax=Methylocystis sp. TaxID=1911079 RepID=UPI003D0A8308
MRPIVPMRRALADPNLFGNILPGESWAPWRVLLIASQGERLTGAERAIFQELTGRNREPHERVDELWCVIGRRGGKTRAVAVLAAYLAALTDFSDILAPGEVASLPILSNTMDQAQKCLQYLRGIFTTVSAFKRLVVNQTADSITLSRRVTISVTPANFRSIRGGTAIAIIADEVATWRSESLANPDVEVLAAARPSLATTGGPLICISSPYARKGVLWEAYKKHHGPDGDSKIIVAQAPSKRMNSTLKDSWIKRQFDQDPFRAAAEYDAQFRSDLESYVSQEAVMACVSPDCFERPYIGNARYVAFVDAAGGSGQDAMTMAVAHMERETAVLDLLREVRPPFSPTAVVGQFVETLAAYKIKAVTGDRFAGEFAREQFKLRGIRYDVSERNKSEIYVELLPRINTGTIDLLDNARMIAQLCNLERRTGRGTGKDVIDHPRDQHDDVINAAAGALVLAAKKRAGFHPTQRMIEMASAPAPYRRRRLGDPVDDRPRRFGIPVV